MTANTSSVEVSIVVCVDETGNVDCFAGDRFVNRFKYDAWLKEKKESNRLWHMRSIKTYVQVPVSYEVIK